MSYIKTFSENSDFYYDECNKGFTRLNRIIVSVANEELSSWSRAYLIPTVYSYWERFFRNTLEEFSQAIASSNLDMNLLHEELLTKIKRREVKLVLDRISLLQSNYLNNANLDKIEKDFLTLGNLVQQFSAGSVFVSNPKQLVKTDSNVRFKVLCDNFDYFGVNTIGMIKDFGKRGIQLNNKLDEFVDLRNDIGHGAVINPLTGEKWNEYLDLVLTLMNLLQMTLIEALEGVEGHKVYTAKKPEVISTEATLEPVPASAEL